MNIDPWRNDRQLIKRWQDGDNKAFKEIFRQNVKKVTWKLVQDLGITHELAEEMFDDSMMVLHQKKETFTVKGRLSTYLYEVAKHKSIDEQRKPINQIMQSFEYLPRVVLDDDDFGNYEWGQEDFETNSLIDKTETIDIILHKALNLIDKKPCKEILVLRYWNELKLAEVAVKLSLDYGYTRKRAAECEKYIKEIVQKLKNKAQ